MGRTVTLIGAALVVSYTLTMSAGDAIVKHVAGQYAAPQLFAISAMIVVALCCVAAAWQGERRAVLRTGAPRVLALRSGLTVLATFAFFMAFKRLPLADIFLFVGLMPVVAAVISGPILKEPTTPQSWVGLMIGIAGVLCLAPDGVSDINAGHLWAGLAMLTGTVSIVLARYVARYDTGALAQVFYPNLAVGLVMAAALPFVWRPMTPADIGWVIGYAVALFVARWLLVEGMARLRAYVAVPLLNLQFIWMVALGYLAFGEVPAYATVFGAGLVILSGLWLVRAETPQTGGGGVAA